MSSYTYKEIGQRVMERNPEAFKGLKTTPEEVGKRIVDRNPTMKSLVKAEAAAPKAPTADEESARATGAFFGANTQNPKIATESAKLLGNIPSSLWGFAKGALDLLNPVSTVKKIGEVVSGVGGFYNDLKAQDQSQAAEVQTAKKLYETSPAAFNKIYNKNNGPATQLPTFASGAKGFAKGAYESIVPEAGRSIISAAGAGFTGNQAKMDENLQKAQRLITNDPVGQILPFVLATKGGAKVLDRTGITKNAEAIVDRTVTKTAAPVIKAGNYAFGAAEGAAGFGSRATKYAVGQATGLQPDTITQVIKNPEKFSKEARGNIDRGALGQEVQSSLAKRMANLEETGEAYTPIKKMNTTVKVKPDYLEKSIAETTGLDFRGDPAAIKNYLAKLEDNVREGNPIPSNSKIQASGKSTIRDIKDIKALQNLYDLWQPIFRKGKLTTTEYLNFRADLANLAKFDREITKSAPLENLAKTMRQRFNATHRKQIKGLEKLDKEFSTQHGELKTLSKGLVDKNGNLTDSAMNRIANATGKGKDLLLERLEEVVPGITEKIKVLKAVEDIEHASGIKVGTYGRTAIGVGFGVAAGIIPAIIEMVLTSPDVAVPLLRKYGLLKNSAAVSAVVNSLKQGKNLVKVGASGVNQLPERASVFGRKKEVIQQ